MTSTVWSTGMSSDSSSERADHSSPPIRTRPLWPLTSSSTRAGRPTRAAGPVFSSGGCFTCRLAMGRTVPSPAAEAMTNASNWKGRPSERAATAAATHAPTARRPSANVNVTSSATPSTAATISQTIQATMAAPQDNSGAALARRNSSWRGQFARALPQSSRTRTHPTPARGSLPAEIKPCRTRGNYPSAVSGSRDRPTLDLGWRAPHGVSRRCRVSRQGSGPDRGTHGRASDAAYADRDAYQRDSYLEADAYPVDPGYQGYASRRERERPRPADTPPGPRTRPERGMP